MFSGIKKLVGSKDLKGKVTRGAMILSCTSIFETCARVIRNMILARMLAPEYFGLMATITMVIDGFEALSEVGLRQVVIQSKRGGGSDFLNVIWWLSLLRGAVLFCLAFLATPWICDFYKEPGLLVPMRIAFAVLFLNGILNPHLHVLEKKLQYIRWAIIRQGPALVGILAAIVASLYFKNIWPLVIGFLIESFGIVLFSFIFLSFKPRFSMEKVSLQEILYFTKGMFGLPILAWVFFNIDIVVIGKYLTMEELGFYSLAKSFALLPIMAFGKTIVPLLLPTFSDMQDDQEALNKAVLNVTDLVTMASIPFIAFCIVFSRPLLTLIYGESYGSVSLPFSCLMIYVIFRLLATILIQLCLSLGKPHIFRLSALIRVVVVLLIILPAIEHYGLVGVSISIVVGMLSLFVFQVAWAFKKYGLSIAAYFSCVLRPLMISATGIFVSIISFFLLSKVDFLSVVIGFIICTASWVIGFTRQHYRNLFFGDLKAGVP